VTSADLGENIAAIIAGGGLLSAGALGFWLKFKKTTSDVQYINDRDSFYKTLKEEIEFLRKEVTRHQSDLINAKTEAAALKVSVVALTERVDELKADKAGLKVELADLETKIDQLVSENEALREWIDTHGGAGGGSGQAQKIGILPTKNVEVKPWKP
jgi:outer membrane murein-binding lipoprotein Lpp